MSYVTKRAKELGLKVQDGTKPLAVAVTNGDVVLALKRDSKRCALARAVERLPGVVRGYIFRTTAYLEYKDRMVQYILPPSVQKEIVSFDRCQVFAPGVYQLSPPGNLRARRLARDRTDEKRRGKERRARQRAKRDLPVFKATVTSGDPLSAEFMGKVAAATQRALDGKTSRPEAKVVKATKQPQGSTRMTIVNQAKYVRDIADPDHRSAP